MATVTIGKEDYTLPELNFKSIKKIWPLVEGIDNNEDMIKLMEAASGILEIALERSDHPLTKEEIEDKMLGSEIPGIQQAVEDLLVESGLLVRGPKEDIGPGEIQGDAPSMETGTPSLENSSQPDAPVETGT